MLSREVIFAALFAQVSTASGFVTKSRTIRAFDQVGGADCPALFQLEGKQHAQAKAQVGTIWTFRAEFYVYVDASNTVAGADLVSLLNTQVDAVVAALAAPLSGDAQTLGGKVTDTRIDGEIETDEGRLGSKAVAIIPVILIATT